MTGVLDSWYVQAVIIKNLTYNLQKNISKIKEEIFHQITKGKKVRNISLKFKKRDYC